MLDQRRTGFVQMLYKYVVFAGYDMELRSSSSHEEA